MKFVSNLNDVLSQIDERLKDVDIEKMTREQATTVMGMMRERIHEQGKSSDGGQIGTYSPSYLRIRSGKPPKSPKRGTLRMAYNRSSDPKVILSLTRQLESDYLIIPVENGNGIGFSNSENYNKSIWNEKRYRKPIFSMTEDEEKVALEIAERYINELDL